MVVGMATTLRAILTNAFKNMDSLNYFLEDMQMPLS